MKSDAQLKQDVINELKWEPEVNDEAIGVAVKDGVVTLSGTVDSYLEKMAAERAAQRVSGVTALAEEIRVKLPSSYERSDEDIAQAAVNALEWNMSVPHDRIKVKVQDGWITLSGEVDWRYQKDAAEDAVCCLMGVVGVSNLITVRPSLKPQEVKTKIESAFQRNAILDAKRIRVETQGDKIILEGTVRSLAEKKEAEEAACAAPGICNIDNRLTVSP
jgi:osmotically-inducible protein OsmY